jgi:hypothetical protein
MADTRLEPLVLSEDERRTLENWVKRRSTAQGLALRARIVLACAEGASNLAVAARLGTLAMLGQLEAVISRALRGWVSASSRDHDLAPSPVPRACLNHLRLSAGLQGRRSRAAGDPVP